jgi:hypothetical protein
LSAHNVEAVESLPGNSGLGGNDDPAN